MQKALGLFVAVAGHRAQIDELASASGRGGPNPRQHILVAGDADPGESEAHIAPGSAQFRFGLVLRLHPFLEAGFVDLGAVGHLSGDVEGHDALPLGHAQVADDAVRPGHRLTGSDHRLNEASQLLPGLLGRKADLAVLPAVLVSLDVSGVLLVVGERGRGQEFDEEHRLRFFGQDGFGLRAEVVAVAVVIAMEHAVVFPVGLVVEILAPLLGAVGHAKVVDLHPVADEVQVAFPPVASRDVVAIARLWDGLSDMENHRAAVDRPENRCVTFALHGGPSPLSMLGRSEPGT